jgi:small subunit ribosomal protein S16
MVKIRLSRVGTTRRPYYRVVAVDERAKRDGRCLEFLGTYDPRHDPERFSVKSERVEAWVAQGARLSPSVKSLIRRARRRQASAGAG